MKMLIQLPLLIREKLNYYRYYVPHKAKMCELNKEYITTIVVIYGLRRWVRAYKCSRSIVLLRYNYRNLREYIKNPYIFPQNSIGIKQLPKRYFYSSGLNDSNGYF